MTDVAHGRGWSLLATEEEVPTVIAGILALDPGQTYTRSEFATAADIPLKTLYLIGTLETLERAGMIERIDDDTEAARFRIDEESEMYQAALAFDDVVLTSLDDV